MILPDTNLLVYAYNSASPFHARAAAWWSGCMDGGETIGLAPVVVYGFLRLATNPRAVENPASVEQVGAVIRGWVARPAVRLLREGGPPQLERVLELLEACGAAGNLVSDAQLAALALEHDATIHSADADFARFSGVRWRNPLAPARR